MTITDDERREVAAKMRGNADDMPFYGDLVADAAGADFVDDEACWKRLADLIEPAQTSSDRGPICDRDALMELADRVQLTHTMLIERGMPLDEAVFYDTGAEFDAIYAERDRTLPLLAEFGVKYTELRPQRPFFYDMLAKPVHKRDGSVQRGYGWCGGPARWGTSAKTRALDRYAKERESTVYVGIAADETRRIARERPEWKRLPLVEWGMTEADCLELCYARGHEWSEGGVRLYDVLDRVSCWCCRNKNLGEIEGIREYLPSYYDRLVALERAIGEPIKRNKALAERGER